MNLGSLATAALRKAATSTRRAIDKLRRRPQPPFAGVREPRRPKPTLPSGAIALAEPKAATHTRIRLFNRRDTARD